MTCRQACPANRMRQPCARNRNASATQALGHLRSVRDSYRDYDWRRENRGGGRYPEHALWEATEGYLDPLDATEEPEDMPFTADKMDLPRR